MKLIINGVEFTTPLTIDVLVAEEGESIDPLTINFHGGRLHIPVLTINGEAEPFLRLGDENESLLLSAPNELLGSSLALATVEAAP